MGRRVCIAVVALVLSFLLDSSVLNFMEAVKNPVFDTVFSWFGHFASLFIILVLMASLFLWEEKKGRWIRPLWLGFVSALIVVYVLKFAFARARPFDLAAFIFLTQIIDYSFPSAHAAAAFAPVPVLDKEYPKLKIFWVVFAVMVALSRLYLGIHYLSDVVGGAIVGYAAGSFFVSLEDRKWKKRR